MPRALDTQAGIRGNFAIRRFGLQSALALGLGLGFSPADALAQVPAPHARSTDDRLAVQVQAALSADPVLKPHQLNLLVNVVDGFAVIGGEVPSESLIPKIRSVALAVENIRAVKVSGWLSNADTRDDPFAKKVAEQLEPTQPKVKLELEPLPLPPLAAPSHLPPLAIPPQPTSVVPLALPKRPEPEEQVVRRPAPTGLFLDPVVSGSAPIRSTPTPGAAPLPYPTIPPPGVPTQPEPGNPRFASLSVKLNGSTATINGTVHKLTDAWDYADAVQKWPGVDTVVVGAVKLK